MATKTTLTPTRTPEAEAADDESKQTHEQDITLAPPRPTPRKGIANDQSKQANEQATQEYQKIHQRIQAMQFTQQAWRQPSRHIQRIQRTLAKNPAIRNAVMQLHRQNPSAFLRMSPKEQFQLIQRVANHLRVLSEHIHQNTQPKPNVDLSNPAAMQAELANASSMASQLAAAQAGVIIAQDNELNQNTLAQDQLQKAEEDAEENTYENNQTAVSTPEAVAAAGMASLNLTAQEESEIEAHNAQHALPTPQPNTTSDKEDDTDSDHPHEVKKVVEHHTELRGAEILAKDMQAEEQSLLSYIDTDKLGMIDAFKGITHEVEESAASAATSILSAVTAG